MTKFIWKFLSLTCICAVFMVIGATNTFAYGTYSGCESCHPGFIGGPDVGALHQAHVPDITPECGNCHGANDTFPVSLIEGTGCVGCHGRLEDSGNDGANPGLGAGLRQHHEGRGIGCTPCHSDTVANYTPVGESNGSTPFYLGLTTLDPCDDGLDNDGNLDTDGEDLDCAAGTYTISGTVSGCNQCHPGDAAGVTITLSGDAEEATVTTSDGTYSFMALDGSYTVTPALPGHMFDPKSAPVEVAGEDVAGVDFSAVGPDTYEISGTVSGCNQCHPGDAAGVTITLSGDAEEATVTTSDGTYSFMALDGSYTVTPALPGHMFDPKSALVEVVGEDVAGVDFSAVGPDTYEISGTVSGCNQCHPGDAAGVNITLSGDAEDTTTTASDGTYSFMALDGSYTVTPALPGHMFDPESVPVEVSGEDVAGVDFSAVSEEPECSIEDVCPCDNEWKNHGAYVRCVAHAAGDCVDAGLISEAEKGHIVSDAAQSDCGKKNNITKSKRARRLRNR